MKNVIILLFLFLSISSCTRESKVSTITIQLPPYAGTNAPGTVSLKSGGFNNTLNPATIADINCYGLFVGGPENFMQHSNCSESSTNAVQMTFGPNKYFMPAGTEVSLEVPSGPARKIYLVGLKSQGTACQLLSQGQNPDGNNLSIPHIISEQVVDLPPGDKTLLMTRTLDSTKKFDSCNFSGGSNNSPALFGNGRDGNLAITGPAFLTFGSDTYTSDPDFSHSLSSLPNPTTKKVSSTKRVTNIDTTTGKLLTLDSAITSNDFEPGDEIIWHVSSAWETANPDYDGCGSGTSLFRGRYGFAYIASVPDSTHVTLSLPITTTPAAINNTNLAQSSAFSGTPFCRIHITRVPNFNIINVAASQTFNVSPAIFNYVNGGIVAFRANEIVLNSGSDLTVNTDGKGFGGTIGYQGDGVQGKGNNGGLDYAANQNGGGRGISGSNSPGGGAGSANGGSGGVGSPGQYGNGITFCIGTTPCLGVRDKKLFFGGGGGSESTLGGAGGGIIFIQARKISGPGALILSAKGANGASGSTGGGGGGGGSVSLSAKQIDSTVTTSIYTNGGNGGTGTTSGGGGGGGSAELRYCLALSPSLSTTLSATGGSGYTAGTAATSAAQEVLDVPALCNTN